MRIVLVGLILLLATISCGNAKTWSQNATDPTYPGMCVYEGIAYEPGEHHVHSTCTRVICSQNGWISGHTCLSANLAGCIRGSYVDKTKPYPECCRRIYTCKHGDGSDYNLEDY